MVNHFYARYGLALTMLNNKLDSPDEVMPEMLISELENGQNHFRLEPLPFNIENESVKFQYLSKAILNQNPERIGKQGKSNIQVGKDVSATISNYLSPTIISPDKAVGKAWSAVENIINELKTSELAKRINGTMSLIPLAGKFNNGNNSQSYPKSSLMEMSCCAITTITSDKPAMLVFRKKSVGNIELINTCVIPDLEVDDLKNFISLFRKMILSQSKGLLTGKATVDTKKDKNTKEDKTIISFKRPKICSGNFPYAPRQSALGSIGLLGAIGRWAKEANYWDDGKQVLDSLKSHPIYIVEYGNAKSASYGHWIVELAKEDFLCDIINAIERIDIISEKPRNAMGLKPNERDAIEKKYELFFLFVSRYLQLFEQKSFQEFLSTRAEYPQELEILFNTYFINAMQKDETIVQSARALGQWLNNTAYWAARKEADNRDKKGDKETIRKLKSKFLAEMESTVFAAKSHDALLAHVVTRAGRLSQSDAPNAAILFFDAVAAGKLTLEESKNLIVAYSRLRSSAENNEQDFSSEPPDLVTDSESESE